ncbi:MAG: nucleotidyltransferase domain-containing protein [Pseudomonadota bacterium]|nr:nucleotidyltransferase domain-containing protein [Pseudomonadota bacterium]
MGFRLGDLHRAMNRATLSLEERKAREASRRRTVVDTVVDALDRYAKAHGGRFHVVGSAVTGQMRYDSDLDVLVEFPPDHEHDAFTFVEDLCIEHRLPLDALAFRTMSARFLARNADRMVTFG